MARRTSKPAQPDTADVQEDTVTVTDSTTELDTSTEPVTQDEVDAANEADASTPAQAKPEKKEEAPIDLTAFTTAIESVVAQRAEENGDLGEGSVTPAQEAYRALDGAKAKNAAKNLVGERMKDSLNALDVNLARAYMAVSESLTAGTGGTKTPAAPADPVKAFSERYQAMLVALYLTADDAPEGVEISEIAVKDADLTAARTLVAFNRNEAEDKGDAPEVSNVARAGVKIAGGKAVSARKPSSGGGGGGGGVRRDIAEHIRQAFAEHESGHFLTVADIRGFKSTEYGDDAPSAGAISARLFPNSGKSTLDFVTPGTGGSNGTTRGATKV